MAAKAKKTVKVVSPAASPTVTTRKPGDEIKPIYGLVNSVWHLFSEDGTPERELTVPEIDAARAAGLIAPAAILPTSQPTLPASVVEAAPVPTKAPRMETPHCATCIHYQAPKGVHQLDADEGVCAQTNQPVKAEDKCAKYAFNEGLRA